MKRTEALLWVILALMVAALTLLIIETFGPKAVCHSMTEDSVITDCDYRNGTWYTK